MTTNTAQSKHETLVQTATLVLSLASGRLGAVDVQGQHMAYFYSVHGAGEGCTALHVSHLLQTFDNSNHD